MIAVIEQTEAIRWGDIFQKVFDKKEMVKVAKSKDENLVIMSEQEYMEHEKQAKSGISRQNRSRFCTHRGRKDSLP